MLACAVHHRRADIVGGNNGVLGEVEACIMNDFVEALMCDRLPPSRRWIIEAWDSAASSLCVDCVANTWGRRPVSEGSPRMANSP